MFARLGIGARLFIAFMGITALSLAPGLAGWLILRQVAESQLRMTAEALPAVAATQHTAKASTLLVAAAPALIAATSEEDRLRRAAQVAALSAEIRKSVTDVALTAIDQPTAQRLSTTVDALVSNLADQSRLVAERIEIDQQFRRGNEQAIAAATAIVDLSDTLVSNASAQASAVVANLYGLIETQERLPQAFDALDSLAERDVYLLDRMWELRLRSSQIGLLLNRLTRALDEKEVSDISTSYRQHLRVVARRVASIDDPVRRQQAEVQLGVLQRVFSSSPWGLGLFDKRLRLLTIANRLERLALENQTLAAQVGGFAQEMLVKSQDFARATAESSQQALRTGFYALVAASLVAIVFSSLIVWLYVEGNIVRRLTSLAGAMRRLTQGDLNVEVQEEGAPELRALSSAVVAFRNETQHRRALELERERTNEELRRHREELRELVDERTRQLREVNANLQNEAENHAAARHRAELASRAKSDFLATMSHEIRTPMTGMLGMLRILREGRLTARQRQQLATASGSGEALLGILNSILDYSKIESGKVTIDREPFRLRDVLQGICDLMQPSANAKGLMLTLDVDRRIETWQMGDAGKLRQILFNLVGNAIKFTETGQIDIRAALQAIDGDVQRIAIAVADTGIGIAEAELGSVFHAFTQTDATVTRRYGGTGLGLSISKGLAEALGGELAVQSAPGRGSTFTLTLPLPAAIAPSADARQAKKSPAPPRRLTVLVVEDDEATRAVAEHFIASLGHEVTTAADGYRAIEAIAGAKPDLVLMDVSLPGMDGMAAAKALRELRPDLPVIAMSAHVFKTEVDRYLASGMDAYVAKPLSPEALTAAIDKAMAKQPWPRDAAHLDVASFASDLHALGSDEVSRILDIVERTVPERLSEIEMACADEDLTAAARAAHAALSAAGSAGFSALAASLSAIERFAASRDLAGARLEMAACRGLYEKAIEEARRTLRERAGA